MDIKNLTKKIARIAVSKVVSYKEREEAKRVFVQEAKQIRSRQDVQELNIGDAICVENDFLGIVVDRNGVECNAIPAYREHVTRHWYSRDIYMLPDLMRTDSSYMNSVNHWIITEAMSYDDGMMNQARIIDYIERNKGSKGRNNFPAIEYCLKKGEGYYLPSIGELLKLQSDNKQADINESLKRFHADEIVPVEGDILYWSSTDDINHEYKWLNDSYVHDSAAYVMRVYAEGNVKAELVSKKTQAYVLPFFRLKYH